MPSRFEDTTVDDLDVGDLFDDDLRDIAENDSRVTASEKAQAELSRRESDNTPQEPAATEGPNGERLTASDQKERANPREEAQIKDAAGNSVDARSAEVGGGQVQADVDRATVSGVFPASGNPPDESHTVAAVTQVPAANPETFEN